MALQPDDAVALLDLVHQRAVEADGAEHRWARISTAISTALRPAEQGAVDQDINTDSRDDGVAE